MVRVQALPSFSISRMTPILDAVVHAYDLDPSNYRNEQHAQGIIEMIFGTVDAASPPGYRVTRDGYVRDWTVDEKRGVMASGQDDTGEMETVCTESVESR